MKEKIRAYIKQGIAQEVQFTDDDNIFELGLVNSLFALQLVLFLEKTFSIKINNEDLDIMNFSSINRLNTFTKQKLVKSQPQKKSLSDK